jgi:hypothetical protein
MNIRKILGCVGSTIVLFTTFLTGQSVTADVPENQKPILDSIDHSLSNFDTKVYACVEKVSLDEATFRFHLMDIAGQLRTDLVNQESETFGGGWIEHSPNFKIVVLFTSGNEKNIEPYLLKYPELSSIVEIRTSKVSYDVLIQMRQNIAQDLEKIGIQADTGTNIYNGNIEIYVTDSSRLNELVSAGKLNLPENIDIIVVKSLSAVESKTDAPIVKKNTIVQQLTYYLYGGIRVWENWGATGNYATSGYAVYLTGTDPSNAANRAMSTAGHVYFSGNPIYYLGIYELDFITRHTASPYDIAIYTDISPGVAPTNQIQYWSDGSKRSITSVESHASMWVGEYVYKYGTETGYTYGQISDLNFNGWVRVHSSINSDLSSDHDSGAPWFRNNMAIGIHHGHADYPPYGNIDATFSPVDYVSSLGYGYSVLVQP